MTYHFFYVARIELEHGSLEQVNKPNASEISLELERLIRELRPLGQHVQRVSVTVEEGPRRTEKK